MAILTYTQRLEEVQTAITKILGGAQQHSIRDRSYSYADLEALYEMEKHYYPLAQREASGRTGIRGRRIVPTT
jgi:hypothetical protein